MIVQGLDTEISAVYAYLGFLLGGEGGGVVRISSQFLNFALKETLQVSVV